MLQNTLLSFALIFVQWPVSCKTQYLRKYECDNLHGFLFGNYVMS